MLQLMGDMEMQLMGNEVMQPGPEDTAAAAPEQGATPEDFQSITIAGEAAEFGADSTRSNSTQPAHKQPACACRTKTRALVMVAEEFTIKQHLVGNFSCPSTSCAIIVCSFSCQQYKTWRVSAHRDQHQPAQHRY